jgi:thiamine monophosphate synthase
VITELNFIGITPFEPSDKFFKELENFFNVQGRALIVRVADEYFSQEFKQEIISISKINKSTVIFNSKNIVKNNLNIHLTSEDLMNFKKKPNRDFLLGASCHNSIEIEKANALGCDYILISPVLMDKYSNKKIGWKGFEIMARKFNGPSYALGGMQINDREIVIKYAGKGIAGIRCFFGNEA